MVGTSGVLNLNLTAGGLFTGTLNLSGVRYQLAGKLDKTGTFSSTKVPGLKLHLNFGADATVPGDIAFTGTAGWQSFTLHHAAYKFGSDAREKGKFTALLKPTSSAGTVPQGIGFASINVAKSGMVILAGAKLADGTAFTGGGTLVGDGTGGTQLIFYNGAVYGRKGHVAGAIAMSSTAQNDCSASLAWLKPPSGSDLYYKQGFDTFVGMTGARYSAPKSSAAVPFQGGVAHATLSDPGLGSAIMESIRLMATNQVTVTSLNPEALGIRFVPGTGTFLGSFHHPSNPGVLTKFAGVLFQNASAPEAAGFYLSPILSKTGFSGRVDLAP